MVAAMGWLARLLQGRLGRERGIFAAGDDEPQEPPRLPRPTPTPTTRPPKRPLPTPTTQPLRGMGSTAGTRTYGTQGGTPSTERIHNPRHPGR
jgi:hypothetical protein